MKKLTPKEIDLRCHEAMVHCNRLVEIFDDFKAHFSEDFKKKGKVYAEASFAIKLREKVNELMPMLEEMNENSFGMQVVKNSTYLTELTTKFETAVRKNYTKIEAVNNKS